MENWEFHLQSIFSAEKYSIDMVRDYGEILCLRFTLFSNKIDDFEYSRAKAHLSELIPYCKAPQNQYRVYVVSGLEQFSLAWITDSYGKVNDFINKIKQDIQWSELLPIEKLEPNLVSSLYIFQDDKIILCEHLYPYQLAWILDMLYDENLIKYI